MGKRRQAGIRLDEEELRRLARDLAARRDAAYAEMRGEVDALKAELAERARAVAERARELDALERRLNEGGVADELAAARRARADAEQERLLAQAERERLEERERQIHAVERELAALRVELSGEPAAPRPTAPGRQKELDEREAALDAREAELDARERALRGDTMAMTFSDGLAALAQPDRN
jgi:chromosome segregation ATPase